MKQDKTFKDRSLELRKTHFTLGNDGNNFSSQYGNDFGGQPISHLDRPQTNTETLTKTNFKLGDYKSQYSTTTNEQNKLIEQGRSISISGQSNVKNDLRKSHFIFGNFEPNYKTISQGEFYDKSKSKNSAKIDGKSIEKQLREHSYVLGNQKPDYKSETHSKFMTPSITERPQQIISAYDLQKSHHVFGNFENPWTTTSQGNYSLKDMEQKIVTKDSAKTNFILGEDRPDLRSISQTTFVPHSWIGKGSTKEWSSELRNHHFSFGNENPDMLSINRQDFSGSTKNGEKNLSDFNKIDSKFLRESHFQLGEKYQNPPDQYATTYGLTMLPNSSSVSNKRINPQFNPGSVIYPDQNKNNFHTESRVNYNYKVNEITKDEIKNMKNIITTIKGHNFELGTVKNDFATTTGATFKFDTAEAARSRGQLDSALIEDLRATHYKIGYMNGPNQTTHQSSYVPLQVDQKKSYDAIVKRNNFNLNQTNRNVFEGRSIYMMDFNKKIV